MRARWSHRKARRRGHTEGHVHSARGTRRFYQPTDNPDSVSSDGNATEAKTKSFFNDPEPIDHVELANSTGVVLDGIAATNGYLGSLNNRIGAITESFGTVTGTIGSISGRIETLISYISSFIVSPIDIVSTVTELVGTLNEDGKPIGQEDGGTLLQTRDNIAASSSNLPSVLNVIEVVSGAPDSDGQDDIKNTVLPATNDSDDYQPETGSLSPVLIRIFRVVRRLERLMSRLNRLTQRLQQMPTT